MIPLLALAAVAVAAASLFLATVFHRRFGAYGWRLARTEDDMTRLNSAYDEAFSRHRGIAERQDADIARQTNNIDRVMTAITSHAARLDSLDEFAMRQQADDGQAAERVASLTRLHTEAEQQIAALRQMMDGRGQADGDTGQALASLRYQMLVRLSDADKLRAENAEVRTQLRNWIGCTAGSAAAGPPAVMPGFAGGGGPAAADILPRLYEDLLRAVGLTAMFRADARPDGVVYYLASASGASQPSPEDLAQLLAACPDDGAALAGLTELRGLLRAMRISQSGAVRLGSLIVRQTADGRCQGAVLTPAEAVALDAAGAAGAEAQWAGQLDRIEGDRLVDLTAWVSRG